LISWATEQATELHDHAGSLGALTVVSGELEEQRWNATERGLRMRRIRAGRGATFDLGHVHDVANTARRTPSACTRTPRRSRRCRTTRSTPAAAWCAPAPS
jgi:Cysteine dioxygenase type I